MAAFERHVFVCGNQRAADHPRGCCDPEGGESLHKRFKQVIAEHGLARTVRAFDPEPGAWALLDGQEVKLFGGRAVNALGPAGEVLSAGTALVLGTGIGALEVTEVQPAGKKRMPVGDWVRGRGVAVGQRLT